MQIIKVLIVDDSSVVRQAYTKLLETDPEIKVIGTASDPYIAVQKIQKERPDVITLDIEMPRMDGLTFLKKIMTQAPMPVVVISNQTGNGAEVALKALEMGAVDVMAKPSLSDELNIIESGITLVDKVRSAFYSKINGRRTGKRLSKTDVPVIPSRYANQATASGNLNHLIAIGASTGGTEALKKFLVALPANMPPILIVQHMPANFTASFANRLNEICALHVKEAEDKEIVKPGTVYIAPGGKHMVIRNQSGNTVISIFESELVNRHRPSVNVLFNSVAEVRGKNAIGIIMTGMGDDGASGTVALREKGAFTVAQDESTSVIFGMPQKAIQAGGISEVLPLDQIAKVVCDRISV
jgi:two-component system, chemotaxis family, protein-glutamate methylesterase/glutaminase